MGIHEFINYVIAKLGDTKESHDIANRILGLLNYNPVLAKNAIDLIYHDSIDAKISEANKDVPEWVIRYKDKDVTLNHGLVIIDNKVADWSYNPKESFQSILSQVLNRIDELDLEEKLAEIRKHLSLAPAETKKAFNELAKYLSNK